MAHFKVKADGNQIRFLERIKSKAVGDASMTVTLHRTLRLPDDGKEYPLPPSLGAFPIKKVDDYAAKVPKSWREHGGVFVPLFQREALWLAFRGRNWKPCALKIAAGKINAVSGEEWSGNLIDGQRVGGEQDYVVAPPQPWLDGFNTGSGVVRQFVAMPLGMGYTVEGQLTGKEDFGGIQLICFDAKDGKFPDAPPPPSPSILRGADGYKSGGLLSSNVGSQSWGTDGYATMDFMEQEQSRGIEGAEMGLAAGGKMKQKIYPDPHSYETWDQGKHGRIFIHIVNSTMWKAITGEECPSSPIDARTYTQNGLPWFDLYDEDKGDVAASGKLAGVKSVGQKDQDHGFTKQQDDTPIEVPQSVVKKQGVPAQAKTKDEVRDGSW